MSNAKTFEGSEAGLKGYIYDCVAPSDADRYATTTTKLQEFVGRTFAFGNDLTPSLDAPGDGFELAGGNRRQDGFATFEHSARG